MLIRVSPRPLARRLARRSVSRVARTIFDGEVKARGSVVEVTMGAPLSIVALPTGEACLFYGAAYLELLRALTGFEGALLHVGCRSQGAGECHWRSAVAEVYE
jgi:hypothetical protein